MRNQSARLAAAVLSLSFAGAACKGTVNDREYLVAHGPPGAAPVEVVFTPLENGGPSRDGAPSPNVAGVRIDGGAKSATLPDPCRGVPLPADQHYVAKGLCARLVASRQGALRELTFLPNGDLIAVTRKGTIRRYRDANGNGVFDPGTPEVVEWASTGGDNGQNCDLYDGYLYCGSQHGVRRWKYSADLAQGGPPEDVMTGQPGGGNHPFHPLHVYDGVLYVDSGSERNTLPSMPDDYITDRAVIKRFPLSSFKGEPLKWEEGEVFVRGARNVTGFTRASNGRMYGVINGFDDLRRNGEDIHADNPGEYVVQLELGQAYGWPFCFAAERVVQDGVVVPPGTPLRAEEYKDTPLNELIQSPKDDAWCAAHMTRPMSFIEAHSAPLDIVIDEGPDGALPARWKGGAFISTHGSWDRKPSTGYKVVWMPLDAAGRAPMPTSTATETKFPYEVVFGGGGNGVPRDGEWGWSEGGLGEGVVRPVGVAISPIDGALYVASDDQAVADHPGKMPNAKGEGAIYRIGSVR